MAHWVDRSGSGSWNDRSSWDDNHDGSWDDNRGGGGSWATTASSNGGGGGGGAWHCGGGGNGQRDTWDDDGRGAWQESRDHQRQKQSTWSGPWYGKGRGKPIIGDFLPMAGCKLTFNSDRHAFYDEFPGGNEVESVEVPVGPVLALAVRNADIEYTDKKTKRWNKSSFVAVQFAAEDGALYWTNFSCDGIGFMKVVEGDRPIVLGYQ